MLWDGSSSSWVQFGQDMGGEGDYGDGEGSSVALSSDGTVVAIGAPRASRTISDLAGDMSGKVRIYKYMEIDGSVAGEIYWQMVMEIDGSAAGDRIGESIALNADGSVVAIGSRYHANSIGHVRDCAAARCCCC